MLKHAKRHMQERLLLKNLTMQKNCKRGPFGLFENRVCCRRFKNEGDPLETFKNFKKSLTKPKKMKEDPLVSFGFVGYVKKVLKNERDALLLDLHKLINLCTKTWYIQDELSGLTKKKHNNSRALFVEKRRLNTSSLYLEHI